MRAFTAVVLSAILAGSADAQNPMPVQGPPMPGMNQPAGAPRKAEKGLQGMARIRYILKQLDLSAEQMSNAEGLIETAFSSGAPAGSESTLDLDKVKSIWVELEAAQKAGDKPKVDKLTEELRTMGRVHQEESQGKTQVPGNAESEFLGNLEKTLNDQQKARLKDALARLTSNPTGNLRPVDVLRAARGAAGLDAAQREKLSAVESKFRTEINTRDTQATSADERRTKLLDTLVADARGVLTPPQAQAFDKKIEAIRPAAEKPAAGAAAKPAAVAP